MSLNEIKEKMRSGAIYDPADAELLPYQLSRINRVNAYNRIPATPKGLKKREKLLKELFGEAGEGCYIEPPFYANLGGSNVKLGKYVYANFHLTLVDDGEIIIGDHVMIGPNVTIATACHPVSPVLRKNGLQYNLPVTVGSNVWIGSGAVILPGVIIGENAIIGAGSVVTKAIPANVIAVGNPCRVLREITEEDLRTYDKGKPISAEILSKYR